MIINYTDNNMKYGGQHFIYNLLSCKLNKSSEDEEKNVVDYYYRENSKFSYNI